LKGAIPEFTNSNVGSFLVTIGADGTMECDFSLKKFKKVSLTSLDFIKLEFRRNKIIVNLLLKNYLKVAVIKHFVILPVTITIETVSHTAKIGSNLWQK
jgi:hypothetical protein